MGKKYPEDRAGEGRLWREYTPEQVQLLSAVATLRRACFRLEEIASSRCIRFSRSGQPKRAESGLYYALSDNRR